jgi:hypothetical protein
MIYIFRENRSTGARLLAEAVGGQRIRQFPRLARAVGDHFVMWGEHVPGFNHAPVLNNVPIHSKFTDAEMIAGAGVPTIQVSRTRPVQAPAVTPERAVDPVVVLFQHAQEAAEEFTNITFTPYTRPRPLIDGLRGLRGLVDWLDAALQVEPPHVPLAIQAPQIDWIPRRNNHVGGNDLLTPTVNPDYWVKKETFTNEYRVHSFMGTSIRAGKKIPREGFGGAGQPAPHSWIRSWDGGWRIAYDGVSVKQRHRDLAHGAVQALGLQFGAVDIGERADGSLVVLEVNRAPGLEGGTVEAYARKIQAWARG